MCAKQRSENPSGYERIKREARARRIALSLAGREIGELPAVAQPDRKASCERDLQCFCETYLPATFSLPWSPDHLRVIATLQRVTLDGGLFALAMPRKSGKTSLCEAACLWAIIYGHHEFVAVIGSEQTAAEELLDSIKRELETNDPLQADFPEVCYPIECLDGIAGKRAGQLFQGERTRISWSAGEIVLPTIAGSRASGAIIRAAGLCGRIRGMKYKRPDGRAPRPSLVILDDPQTDVSARSEIQSEKREAIVAGTVLGLAGHGRRIAAVMPCTVIQRDDLADRMLDRETHPDWQGERTKLIYAMPTAEKLWQQYGEIRAEALRSGQGLAPATEFYREHRAEMDRGAKPAWADRFNTDELSAVQHAMNLKFQDEPAFQAEYQNDPLQDDEAAEQELSAGAIGQKLNRLRRRQVPLGCEYITAFIDVHQKLLYWMVTAWAPDFTGAIIDYGTWPDQRRHYFHMREARITLARKSPGAGLEGSIYRGLENLAAELAGREWPREDGARLKMARCLIDANWGQATDVVYQFCRQSAQAALFLPSHGRFVGARHRPMSEYKRAVGELVGHNWRIPSVKAKRAIRHVIFDTNYWKSFVAARLLAAAGDRASLAIFGADPKRHRLLIEHLMAEHAERTEGQGRVVYEWTLRPGRRENHWLDCLVGAAVAGSMVGCALAQPGARAPRPRRPKRRVTLSELQRQRRMSG